MLCIITIGNYHKQSLVNCAIYFHLLGCANYQNGHKQMTLGGASIGPCCVLFLSDTDGKLLRNPQ